MGVYHVPVMLDESLDALKINPDGVYVDATFGAGGHSQSILKKMSAKGRLYGFDQDEDAELNFLEDDRFTLIRSNFRYLDAYLRVYGEEGIDGVLMDLGVSSHQFDEASRGFSYRFDAELDMRMNQEAELDAKKVLNAYSVNEIQDLLSSYGEVRNAKTLAKKIVAEREVRPFQTTFQLNEFLQKWKMGDLQKYQSQVYQALRIEVNDEVGALKDALMATKKVLKPGGRLVVITYHSLEDRIVKNFIRSGNPEGRIIKDDFGNVINSLITINKKPILASEGELKRNSRSRSAKMRIAEKVKNYNNGSNSK